MNIPFSPPDITQEEIKEVTAALLSGWITTGPRTKEFEKKIASFCGTSRAVCLNSATACLEMTLRVMGIGPGDEVITTAYTYTATCSCICHTGATPVLVDTLPGSFEMDPEKVAAAVTERTKVILCVDLAGIIYGHYERIFQIIEEKKHLFRPSNPRQDALGRIIVMSDSAHALGSTRKGIPAGQIADFSCFSFHAVKNLTTAEGGAVTWSRRISEAGINEDKLYKDYMLLSLHGQSKDALSKMKAGSWEYDVVAPYYKCNMTDVIASIGLAQIRRYPGIMEKRRNIIKQYDEAFAALPVELPVHLGEDYTSNGHLYMVRLNGKTREECNEIIAVLEDKGIATNVHYKPLPMLTAYRNMGFDIQDYPNAYRQFENEITLPLNSCLTQEQADYVIQEFKNVF